MNNKLPLQPNEAKKRIENGETELIAIDVCFMDDNTEALIIGKQYDIQYTLNDYKDFVIESEKFDAHEFEVHDIGKIFMFKSDYINPMSTTPVDPHYTPFELKRMEFWGNYFVGITTSIVYRNRKDKDAMIMADNLLTEFDKRFKKP